MIRKILIFFMIPLTLYAAPSSVTLSSGTLSHGQSITISGTGFGSKSQAAPVAWDNLEDGSCNTTATVGTWTSVNSLAINSNNNRHTNSSYNGTCNFNAEMTGGFNGGADAPKWFVQYWFKLDSDWNWSNNINNNLGNVKFIRFWSTGSDSANFVMAFHYAGNVSAGMEYVSSITDWSPVVTGYDWVDLVLGHDDPGYVDAMYLGWEHFVSDLTKNTWHCLQWEYQDSDTDTANGEIRMWLNGVLILDHSDITTRSTEHTANKRPYIVGFYNSHGVSADGNDHFYIDDAYIDNTWSRVEIGNANVYENCTHREIQIPSAWTDTSISVDVNQGSFSADDKVYLFVVDSDGATGVSGALTISSSTNSSTSNSSCSFQ